MAKYNPNRPGTLGCEFFSDLEGVDRLGGDLQVAGAVLTSTATETISTVHVGLTGNNGREAGWEMEIYDPADLPTNITASAVYRPGCDLVNKDMYGWNGTLQTSNLYTLIDDTGLTPSTYQGRSVPDNDWINPLFGSAAEYSCQFASIAGTLDGYNITRVRWRARVGELVDSALVEGATFTPFLEKDGRRKFGNAQTFSGEPGISTAQTLVADWKANPFTGASWKPQDLDDFDCSGGSSGAGWVISATGSSNNLAVVFQGYLEVTYLDEADVRLAVGVLTDPTGQVGWQSFDLTAPDGTANWAKADATDYLFVFRRRVGDSGYLDWRYLIDQEKVYEGPPNWQIVTPALYPSTLTLSGQGANRDGVYAILLEDNAGNIVDDSQAYLSINDDGGPQTGFQHTWTHVNTTTQVMQEITTDGGGGDYGVVRFLVAWEEGAPDANLLVRLKLRSTSALLGGVLSVAPLDLTPPRARFQVYEAEIPSGPVTLAGSTQYFLEFSSAASEGAGWRIQVLSTLISTDPGGPPADAYTQNFEGVTDVAEVGSTEYPSLDAAATIATQPDPVTSLAADVTTVAVCRGYATVTWDASAESDFDSYEIERMDDTDEGWLRIGKLSSASETTFVDVEARRGVDVTYRVRVRRGDRSFSSWATSTAVQLPASCCGYVLASNEARNYGVFVADIGERGYTFPAANAQTDFLFLAGRDGGAGFGEIEDRGTHFTFTGLVAANGATGGVTELVAAGIDNFDALRLLLSNMVDPAVGTKLALSYVAVLDETGARWLADVKILDGVRAADEGEAHRATIQVRDTKSVPSVVVDGGAGSGS